MKDEPCYPHEQPENEEENRPVYYRVDWKGGFSIVRIITRLTLFLVIAVFILLPWSTKSIGAINWTSSMLKEVYNPQGNFYTYAPSVIQDGNIQHMWTCHNTEEGVIRDHIVYTELVDDKAVKNATVLSPGDSGSWDSFHVCDPSVVAGTFLYESHTYSYAMFYLGNDVNASTHNQIGVAFADALDGQWTKYPEPIVTYPDDGFWGVGQASATSVDKQGRLLLFYTQGDSQKTTGYRRDINLHDMSNPVIGTAVPLTLDGLTGIDGKADWLNNFDVIYDPSRDRFFTVREQHPNPSDYPTYIGASLQIVSIEGGSIWNGGGSWKVEGEINSNLTGFPRNHNSGMLRTAYGTLPDSATLQVFFTDSNAGTDLSGRPEFTYDIWETASQLTDGNLTVTTPLENFSSKYLTVKSITVNRNTNVVSVNGKVETDKSGVWVGYHIFDHEGYLLIPGTAHKDKTDPMGAFIIPIMMPETTEEKDLRLEIYLLSAKGDKIDSVERKIDFR
jgi:hypothetical protein